MPSRFLAPVTPWRVVRFKCHQELRLFVSFQTHIFRPAFFQTHVSLFLTIESPVAQWLEHLGAPWRVFGFKSYQELRFFVEFSDDAISIIYSGVMVPLELPYILSWLSWLAALLVGILA